jgi:hypothetical protein
LRTNVQFNDDWDDIIFTWEVIYLKFSWIFWIFKVEIFNFHFLKICKDFVLTRREEKKERKRLDSFEPTWFIISKSQTSIHILANLLKWKLNLTWVINYYLLSELIKAFASNRRLHQWKKFLNYFTLEWI